MASTTGAPYNIPYQQLGDSPNGADGQQDLATQVHAMLAALDAKITAINALAPASVGSTTDEAASSSTAFIAGASPVGVAFTAPPSGDVYILFSAIFSSNIATHAAFVSVEVKTGGTVGSGTLTGGAANSDRALICGRAVTAGGPALLSASRGVRYTGLTPGATYNARVMYCVDNAANSITVTYREVVILPQL
jgi:hypothetical protein